MKITLNYAELTQAVHEYLEQRGLHHKDTTVTLYSKPTAVMNQVEIYAVVERPPLPLPQGPYRDPPRTDLERLKDDDTP